MSILPSDAVKIEVEGSTLDFYQYEKDNIIYFYFDSSMTAPPEPMINAMSGLRLITDSGKKLVMVNHKAPGGLFTKIGENFDFELDELENGNSVVVFSYKEGATCGANLNQTHCDG